MAIDEKIEQTAEQNQIKPTEQETDEVGGQKQGTPQNQQTITNDETQNINLTKLKELEAQNQVLMKNIEKYKKELDLNKQRTDSLIEEKECSIIIDKAKKANLIIDEDFNKNNSNELMRQIVKANNILENAEGENINFIKGAFETFCKIKMAEQQDKPVGSGMAGSTTDFSQKTKQKIVGIDQYGNVQYE